MTEMATELRRLGDSLQSAWEADHRKRVRRQPWRRFAIVVALVVLFIAVGAAIASTVLKSNTEEEQGLLGGHLLFKGTHPSCQALTATSFICHLETVPTEMSFYGADGKRLNDAYLGVKAATVDAHHHVDGGCVSTAADGRTWRCYLGQEAVTHGIVGADYLGDYLPDPPTG
jgi:hypothetical protein